MSHIDIAMCGSFNFEELHQGYSNVLKLLGVFNNCIKNDECAWLHGGVIFFSKIRY
jgi:hypothetical protein